MPNPAPPGIPTDLWNLAIVVTAIQALQAQPGPITAQQVADVQAKLPAATAAASAVSNLVAPLTP